MKPKLFAGVAAAALFAFAGIDLAAAQNLSRNDEACWEGTLSHKVYTFREIRDFAFQTGGLGVTPGDYRTNTLHVRVISSGEVSTTYKRVPCPTPPSTWGFGTTQTIDQAASSLYGAYVQVSGGGGRSVTSEGEESGKGSSSTIDASVGWRERLAGGGWQSFNFGATFFERAEQFQPPLDDLHVKPGVILYQSYMLGPNFPGFGGGQNFAPYFEVGVAEGLIKVSTPAASASRWNVAPMVGGGLDYRINPQWLIHSGVKVFFFGEKNYPLGGSGTFRVSDRATSATIGLIYQFDSSLGAQRLGF